MQGRRDAPDHDIPNLVTFQGSEYLLRLEAEHSALLGQDPCAMSAFLEVERVPQEP
jgi:hypothetical protein